jgi:putative PIN family toxin of toxin-antitoxin system
MPEYPTRFVADTNLIVGRLLFRNSLPGTAFERALLSSQLIVCTDTLSELEEVLSRPKFDLYLSLRERLVYFHNLRKVAHFVESVAPITACRDPKDDKFLALATTGQANLILSGDQDLLTMNPFHSITILSPRQYLDRYSQVT